jgi:hypothetical protein
MSVTASIASIRASRYLEVSGVSEDAELKKRLDAIIQTITET